MRPRSSGSPEPSSGGRQDRYITRSEAIDLRYLPAERSYWASGTLGVPIRARSLEWVAAAVGEQVLRHRPCAPVSAVSRCSSELPSVVRAQWRDLRDLRGRRCEARLRSRGASVRPVGLVSSPERPQGHSLAAPGLGLLA